MGVTSLLDIGRRGLFAAQTSIETTSNNISNVNTEGYTRRTVRLEESPAMDSSPGQLGTGVDAVEVVRHFDRFVEGSFLDKSTMSERYAALAENLKGLDNLFNDANSDGISQALSTFFNDWQDLAERPNDYANREALIADTSNLLSVLHQADQQLSRFQQQTDQFIKQDVDRTNELMRQIAEVNKQIRLVEAPGQNNANTLRDKRDLLVRELATKLDVKVIDQGGAKFTVLTSSGEPLVDGENAYELRLENGKVLTALRPGSTFDGQLYYDGTDDFEYTLEVTDGGTVGGGAAQYRVSLDGGKSWLKDASGNEARFPANASTGEVDIRGMKLWFGTAADPNATPAQALTVGDRFTVIPKSGLYWHQDTSTAENVTPQRYFNGEDNARRLTGGSLAGQFEFRDNAIGRYREKLDTLSRELVWQVNALHSQGAGLERQTEVNGTYRVLSTTAALGLDTSGLAYRDKLQAGSSMIYVYDGSGNMVGGQGYALDFGAGAGQQNFDPATHSLDDVAAALNRTFTQAGVGATVQASVVNNALRITATGGQSINFGQDSTGLYAALGINTFFEGDAAGNVALNNAVATNRGYIAAGHVNGAGEANAGDNTTSQAIGSLQNKTLTISTVSEGTVRQSLSEFYNSLVTSVGADAKSAEFNRQYQKALADDLNERQQSASGVNLDEEMSNLIRFQHSYTACAKLISTADQMMQTLLGLKN